MEMNGNSREAVFQEIISLADAMADRLTARRRDFHKYAETGWFEMRTSSLIARRLTELGYEVLTGDQVCKKDSRMGVPSDAELEKQYERAVSQGADPEFVERTRCGMTGVIGILHCGEGPIVGMRFDIDALGVFESESMEHRPAREGFASVNRGFMHACGHDGHMTALLGLAYKLKDVQDLPHNVLLIFQPGEEVVNGAPSIINTGIFEKYHVKGIYGLHMFPDVDEGKIACRKGPLMAESGELDVTVHGKSAHAGKYHEGIDSIVIASFLISNYQSIISRMISPMQPCVLNIGEIHGGTVRNIVASQTSFHGTLRTYSEEVFSRIVEAMKGFNQGMEQAYHCQIDFACQPFNPPVLNDAHLYEELKKNVGANFEELEEPVMLAEDFAHYQKVIPGVFFYVGTRCKEYTSGLHTPTFNFHEEVLVQAVELYEKLARNVQLGD